ncbi:hypothetical protein ABB37_02965 [Leptomonas pyrrhocoris]|uniref:Uncharacterized protein n=1 Tax=Leptomonas pyrrhocoris TaxID=157538 RepID=A0A0N0DXX1_LEPPY|nr:hypothetical protein ABB37_02965 [Leptomonas pyrrhocoris]KPA83302.1 hypothetical protein ABB37_02965 [Leptomonas pyrrhocoris]|eukprot:XP_015661741.1 hypothetical protein ABB37_02965 [Leptomonas pyrrhocoris]
MSVVASPTAGPPPCSSYELLGPKEAGLFYEEACRREGLHIHSTFLKQLLLGSVLIQFENGYLGGNGISPIVQTLQRIPLHALLLSKCALSSEDVKLLCAGLATHPQLEKIDVRGVELTIGAVKELLHLATRNTHITEILMDEGLPKFVAVQQQCERNAQAGGVQMSACVACNAGVSVEARSSCETLVLRFVLENLKPHTHSISAACLTMLCGALQLCIDRNDGVLSVCGEACAESLANDLCRCVWSVPKAFVWNVPYDLPKISFLRTFLSHKQGLFQRDRSALEAASSTLSKSFFQPGPVDARAEESWRTRKPRSDIDVFFDNTADRDVARCTICGQPGVCTTDGPTWLLRTLQIDLEEHGAAITPAALLRLCRLFTAHACVRPCSRRCLRHLVRYALYGYGGVNCSYVGGFPPLSSVLGGAAELLRLPLVDFTVVDIAAESVDDVASEEINCALTVASAVSDTDGVAMDPYLVFSIGRQLRKMSTTSIGMDLASACEAVRLVGCLPAEDAPYKRSGGDVSGSTTVETAARPPRDLVADWSAWSAASGQTTVRRWLHSAFAHRRQRVCSIDGPHRDVFDNTRAALWALRQQGRSVLVTLKIAMWWLSLKDGVVPTTTSGHTHGFFTTAKIIGQSTRVSTVYLILQCPFGKHVGNNGLLYVPKPVFLQCVRGLAFVFADALTMEYRAAGWRASLYANELVGPALGVPNSTSLQRLRQLFSYISSHAHGRKHIDGAAWRLIGCRVPARLLLQLFDKEHLPAALRFLGDALGIAAEGGVTTASATHGNGAYDARDAHRTYWERILLSSRYPSQLLFFFSEVLGSGRWLQQAFETAATIRLQTAPESSPPPSEAATQSMGAGRKSRDAIGATRAWLTLSTVPDLNLLSHEPATIAEAIATKAEAPSPLKVGRGRGSWPNTSTTSTVPGDTTRTSRSPKPPKSQPPAQTSSRGRVRGAPLVPSEFAPSLVNSSLSVSRTALTGKSAQATEKVPANPTAVGMASALQPSSVSTSQNKLQHQLQKGWKVERTVRNALLKDAARVGVVEYLRTWIQASRAGESPFGATQRGGLGDFAAAAASSSSSNAGPSSGMQDAADNDIPAHLFGKPWFAIPVQVDDNGDNGEAAPPDLHLLFIGNSVSVYSMHASRLLCRPTLMSADALTATFPFATGVDAAAVHPTNADLAFFFSGREWLLFHLRLLECVDGPYPLGTHGQFRKLPAAFHESVDSVIAIPNSSKLVFFRGYSYVVFDALTRRCVGGVGLLHQPLSDDAEGGAHAEGAVRNINAPALAEALRRKKEKEDAFFNAVRPFAASQPLAAQSSRGTAAAPLRDGRVMEPDGDTVTGGDVPASSCALHITPELQRLLGTAPMSSLTTRNAVTAGSAASSVSHWLVNRRGDVVAVEWELQTINTGATARAEGTARTDGKPTPQWVLRCLNTKQCLSASKLPLADLPLVFRQSSPSALPALCALAMRTDFVLEDAYGEAATVSNSNAESSGASPFASRLQLFDPEGGKQALVSAALIAAAGGDRSPGSSLSSTVDSSTVADHRHTRGSNNGAVVGAPDAADLTTAAPSIERTYTPATVITSSLASTSVAQRMPLALSRSGPVVAAHEKSAASSAGAAVAAQPSCGGWEREVFFYGDGGPEDFVASQRGNRENTRDAVTNTGLGTPYPTDDSPGRASPRRRYIEYDLGLSEPRRAFSALLLVLDTSFLPSAVLQLAPLTASVECSMEGEIYFPQAVLRIAGPVTAAKWRGGPLVVEPRAARFWRLRFHTSVPVTVGIVRLFWFEAPCGSPRRVVPSVPLSTRVALPLTVHTAPGYDAVCESGGASGSGGFPPIRVDADCVVASPELLLRSENMLPVIVDDPSAHPRGWYGHHTVFPLPAPHSTTCLICCDASFIEVHVGHSRTSSSSGTESGVPDAGLWPSAAAQDFADYSRFRGLPYPFALGWDANFYPSPQEQPGLLCLIRGDLMLMWDIETGKAQGAAVAWRQSALLEGLRATPMARVVATVNCWSGVDTTSVVAFFYEPSSLSLSCEVEYIEFDVIRQEVVYGPATLASHLRTRYGASLPSPSSANTLLTVLCSPQAPSTLFLLYAQAVYVLSVKGAGAAEASMGKPPSAIAMTESPVFYTVPLLLPKWGTRHHHCDITLDLASLLLPPRPDQSENDDDDMENEGALVVGMQLISSGGRSGCATGWQVQCSEHGRVWEDVAVHRQNSGEGVVGETTWTPRAAGRYSTTRFWRFKRLSCSGGADESSEAVRNNSDDCLQSYSQLRLLSIPRRRCVEVPVRVSGTDMSACSTDVCSSFFATGARASTLALIRRAGDNTTPPSVATDGDAYELVWDYGLSLIVLSGVTFTTANKPANAQLSWTVYGSAAVDAGHWTPLATTVVTSDAAYTSLSWVPGGPYRYWRLACAVNSISGHTGDGREWPATLLLSAFRVYVYEGPLVGLQSVTGGHLHATSLLWPSSLTAVTAPCSLPCNVNGSILLNRVVEALTWCKLDFCISSDCTVCVAMEWSADATEWCTVALITFSIGNAVRDKVHEAVLSWQSCGPRRLWRIRVQDVTSNVTFMPLRLHLGTSPAEHVMKLPSKELLFDATMPLQPTSATPALTRKSSVQTVADKRLSGGTVFSAVAANDATTKTSPNTAAAAAAAAVGVASATRDLRLQSPQRLIGVRAALPSLTSRYAVEYLGLDGVSWISASVLQAGAVSDEERQRMAFQSSGLATDVTAAATPQSIMASAWWDGASVSPSTQWRLKSLTIAGEASSALPPTQQSVRGVEWFAEIGMATQTVDTSEVPGVVVGTTGFNEVRPPLCLSGKERTTTVTAGRSVVTAAPVLQCTVVSSSCGFVASSDVESTVTWSFVSPVLLDQLSLHLRATLEAVEENEEGAGGENGATPASPVNGEAALQSLWVETSDNGEDFVAVAHSFWWLPDTTVTLSWEEVPPAPFWRLRLSKVAAAATSPLSPRQQTVSCLLEIFAACWGVRRSSPALTAHVRIPALGSFTNTAYRTWLKDCFNHEDAFMRECQDALDEVRSVESKLRTAGSMSAPAMVAAVVQRMRAEYQMFIQKTAKEAARLLRLNAEDDKATASPTPAATYNMSPISDDAHPRSASWPSVPNRVHASLLSPERASSDVVLLLHESATNPLLGASKWTQLAELLNYPLAFREAYRFTKNSLRWFYPCLEIVGQSAQEWYGFPPENVCASFCVYWSLSSALQRRKDALLASNDLILPLSEHVASPIVVVQINELDWSPSQHFPNVPFLCATNFNDRPTTVVFALNDIVFTPPYALGAPSAKDSQALTSAYPYTISAGVNFVQARRLDSCPAPVFDVLRYILAPSFFQPAAAEKGGKTPLQRRSNVPASNNDNLVLMVLTTSSLQQGSGDTAEGVAAQLRFTVPAEGVDFGLRGLVIDALEFEVTMAADGPAKQWSYQTTFVTHGARFVAQGGSRSGSGDGATEVPVSLLGNVEMHGLPVVGLRGSLGNARLTAVADVPGAVVTNVIFHTIAQVERVPASVTVLGDAENDGAAEMPPPWECFPLQSEGLVALPGMPYNCSCTCVLNLPSTARGALEVSQLQVALHRCSLSDVQAFCRACSGGGGGEADPQPITAAPVFPAQPFDVCGVHVQLAAFLKVAARSPSTAASQRSGGTTLHGQGLLYLDNNVLQGATVEMFCGHASVTVMATCPHPLRFGALVVEGTEEHPVSVQLLLSASPPTVHQPHQHGSNSGSGGATYNGSKTPCASRRLLIAGSAHLFGRQQRARVSLELSYCADTGPVVTLVGHSLRHAGLVASVQDSAVSLAWRYAQVTVDELSLRRALARELGHVPIVAALRAHGIPLVCVVSTVNAAPFDLSAQRLSLRLKGQLFGASFDVTTSVVCPDDAEDAWSVMAARLCPEVVEQCEENLWASYANVVGCRMQVPQDAEVAE